MRRRGFTVIEMMIAACVLTIILGLAVSLSRHVRGQSARVLTYDVLARLERMLGDYAGRSGGAMPSVTSMGDGDPRTLVDRERAEEALFRAALRNNRDFLRALRGYGLAEQLAGLPPSIYDPGTGNGGDPELRDAWGTPIVFGRSGGVLGSSPRGGTAPFFVSAGPDRKFLTHEDNLYSYEAFRRPE